MVFAYVYSDVTTSLCAKDNCKGCGAESLDEKPLIGHVKVRRLRVVLRTVVTNVFRNNSLANVGAKFYSCN